MTTVVLTDEMQALTGGAKQLQLEATTYRALLKELDKAHPSLDDEVFAKFSIAIDGTIVHRPLLERFGPGSEVVFIPKIASG